jgi:hypothetical protein
VELNRKPVPAELPWFQKACAELVIHPTAAPNSEINAVNPNRPFGLQTRERVVVRGIADHRPLLTQAPVTVKHQRFFRRQSEVNLYFVLAGLQVVVFAIHPGFPVTVPNDVMPNLGPGLTCALTTIALKTVMLPASEIGDRKVSRVQVSNRPL